MKLVQDPADRWAFIRSVHLYRPYPDEVPWALFDRYPGSLAAETLEALVQLAQEHQDQAYLRVAKLQDEAVGAYLIQRESVEQFQLKYLAVVQERRNRGLGSWLTGHAIGIAESKGGQELTANSAHLKRFLGSYGFEERGADQVFRFTPE